jgi:hypothetical protein
MDHNAEQRRAARSSWPIVRHALGEDTPDVVDAGTPSERIAMVHQLTLDAWAMAGQPIPDYPRSEAPGRILRRTP